MRIIVITALVIFLTSCSTHELNYDDVAESIGYAEQKFRSKGVVALTSSERNEQVKFRIMVKDKISNEKAKELVEEYINSIESRINDKELFNKSYLITFDIKSEKDGNILVNGKREKGTQDIWWQF